MQECFLWTRTRTRTARGFWGLEFFRAHDFDFGARGLGKKALNSSSLHDNPSFQGFSSQPAQPGIGTGLIFAVAVGQHRLYQSLSHHFKSGNARPCCCRAGQKASCLYRASLKQKLEEKRGCRMPLCT